MSHSITEIDYDALPEEMLPFAKQHMRVDFESDDETILAYLQWAIGYAEQATGLSINPATVVWLPPLETGRPAYQFPLQPVSAFTVADSDGGDISSDFAIKGGAFIQPVFLIRTAGGAFPPGMTVSFQAGVALPAQLMPPLSAAIYRIAATLYENREHVSTLSLEATPLWLNDLLTGIWIPRA